MRPLPTQNLHLSRFVLPAALLCHLCAVGTASAQRLPSLPRLQRFIRGDVNRDGDVDTADAAHLALSASGTTVLPCLDSADVDDNGSATLHPLRRGDLNQLMDWLVSTSPVHETSALPSPFPGAGIDPTTDGLDCAGGAPPSSEEGDRRWRFDWSLSQEFAVPGERDVSLKFHVSTAGGISGFSLAYLIHRRVMRISSVVPLTPTAGAGGGGGFRLPRPPPPEPKTPLIEWSVKPSNVPDFDLLQVVVIYVNEADLQPLDVTVTDGAVSRLPVLDIRFDVRNDAPEGESTLLAPFVGKYALIGELDGLFNEFVAIVPGRINIPDDLELMPLLIAPEPEVAYFLRGDSNQDGEVTIADPVKTLHALFFGGSPLVPHSDAADANDDEIVDISDAQYTLDFLFKANVTSVPAPYPTCGPDSTPSSSSWMITLISHKHGACAEFWAP